MYYSVQKNGKRNAEFEYSGDASVYVRAMRKLYKNSIFTMLEIATGKVIDI